MLKIGVQYGKLKINLSATTQLIIAVLLMLL